MDAYFHSKTQHTTAKYSQQLSEHSRAVTRLAIGPLARQNSASAYSPSLNCHLLAPTIDSLHNSRDPQEISSTGPSSGNLPTRTNYTTQSKSEDYNLVTIEILSHRVHCRVRNNILHCCVTGHRRQVAKETSQ
jgi:hypothetical protein